MIEIQTPSQFVMLAFDGSKNVDFWQSSRQFAKDTNVRFTYFMSGVYFLMDTDKNKYVEPDKGKGKSNIGFGGSSLNTMRARLEEVQLAMKEGHEMASHANGHYDGSMYTVNQWDSEFNQFTSLMSLAWERYNKPGEPKDWRSYFANNVLGFRAPLLGVGNRLSLWKAFKKYRFAYDTSLINKMGYWPQRIEGIWSCPLAGLKIVGSGKNTLSMDYNFYYTQSKAKPGPKNKYQEYEDEMFNTYVSYFEHNYYGNRAPVHIGHHFSLWNGGAYWKAMQRFARHVNGKKDVVCGTYKELLSYLEMHKDSLAAFQAGDFEKPSEVFTTPVAKELTEDELDELRAQANEPAYAHVEE